MPMMVIRNKYTDEVIASGSSADDTARVFEGAWYFPTDRVDTSQLKLTERTYNCPYKGICYWYDMDTPDGNARNIAWVYQNPLPNYAQYAGWIAFYPRESAATTASPEQDAAV